MSGFAELRVAAARDSWGAALLSPGTWAIVLYRIGRRLWLSRGRAVNPVWYFYVIVAAAYRAFSKIELPETASIGERLYLPHPHGLVVGAHSVIGDDCTLGPWVVVGHNGRETQMPTLEERVYVGPKASILGPVRVGAGALVGAGAVVTSDVPPGGTVRAISETYVRQAP